MKHLGHRNYQERLHLWDDHVSGNYSANIAAIHFWPSDLSSISEDGTRVVLKNRSVHPNEKAWNRSHKNVGPPPKRPFVFNGTCGLLDDPRHHGHKDHGSDKAWRAHYKMPPATVCKKKPQTVCKVIQFMCKRKRHPAPVMDHESSLLCRCQICEARAENETRVRHGAVLITTDSNPVIHSAPATEIPVPKRLRPAVPVPVPTTKATAKSTLGMDAARQKEFEKPRAKAFDCKGDAAPTGGQRPISDRLMCLLIKYHQCATPMTRMMDLFLSTAKTLGVQVQNSNSERTCSRVQERGGVLGLAEMGSILYNLTHTTENRNGVLVKTRVLDAKLTAVIDAASCGEKKVEGAGFVRPEIDPVTGETVFTRLMLGLYELAEGTDEAKIVGIMELMSDCVDAYNAIFGEEKGELLYLSDLARNMLATINDHAETVVKNKFVPEMRKLVKEAEKKERLEAAIDVCMRLSRARAENKRWRQAALQVTRCNGTCALPRGPELYPVVDTPQSTPCVCSDGAIMHAEIDDNSTAVSMKLGMKIVKMMEQNDEIDEHFCHLHKIQLGMKGAMSHLTALEKDYIEESFGRDSCGDVSNAIYSMSKAVGKGKFHDTLSHGKILSDMRKHHNTIGIHFERHIGCRGDQANFANALPVLQMFLDEGAYGAKQWFRTLDAKNKETNRMHRDLTAQMQKPFILAALRMMALYHVLLFRPIQTYVQNSRTSIDDMVPVMKEYRLLVERLKNGDSIFDLPFKDAAGTQLLKVAADPRVLNDDSKLKTTDARRREAMAFLRTPQHGEMKKMMAKISVALATGMAEKFDNNTSARYGGDLLNLPPDHPRRVKARSVPCNSDAVETYFGDVSWLMAKNGTQTLAHLNLQLAIMETRLGDKLLDLLDVDPVYVHRILKSATAYVDTHMRKARAREGKVLEHRMRVLTEALTRSVASKAKAKAKLSEAETFAHAWVHEDAMTLASRLRVMTRAATRDWLKDRISMFKTVHHMHTVTALKDVYYARCNAEGKGQTSILKRKEKVKFFSQEQLETHLKLPSKEFQVNDSELGALTGAGYVAQEQYKRHCGSASGRTSQLPYQCPRRTWRKTLRAARRTCANTGRRPSSVSTGMRKVTACRCCASRTQEMRCRLSGMPAW